MAAGYEIIDRNEHRRRRRRKRRVQSIIRCTILLLIIAVIIILAVFGIYSCTSKKKIKTASEGEITSENIETEDVNAEVDEPEEEPEDKIVVTYPDLSSMENLDTEEIKSPYVVLLDVTDNKVLAGRNAETRIYPASMTKVMTLIVAVENIEDLSRKFTMTSQIIDPVYLDQASIAGFAPGEEVTAKDLMYGLILPSGADSAVGLAQMVAGTEEEFVNLMNEKCVEMGLKNTHFTNTSGLHNADHYTTPVEQAMILEYAMENETCAEILSTYQYTTEATEKHPEGILLTSTMFGRMYGDEVPGVIIKAGKTGYTQEALQCLVSYAESKDKKYVAVTAGASGRWDCIYDDFNLYGKYCVGAGEAAQGTEEDSLSSTGENTTPLETQS